ncbi:MAG: rhomboid family intramembrane serine protease [Myxococcota bacterium]|nr:rhomboid family intramembrane serine protease [Myxococcota bacterium]
MSLFFVLVTQADGSARRIPFVTIGVAIALFAAWSQMQGGNEFADRARADAVDYLHESPFVEVDPRYETVIPVAYADALREEFYNERREQGLAPISDFLVERSQGEFVDLLAYALAKVGMLPVWRFGIESSKADSIDWLAHVGVHETAAALWLSIAMLLLVGVALEDAWGPLPWVGLAIAGTLATASASVALGYAEAMKLPWFGASGLIATLLGAHFVRSLGGSPRAFGMIPLPGLLVLPAWLAADTLLVRGVTTLDDFDAAPLFVQSAGLVLGAVVAIGMGLAKFESHQLEKETEAEEVVSNPALERAMAAREAGRVEQAFDILRAEHRRAPDNRDVSLALWDTALPIGKASRVAEAMLSAIESDLHAGSGSQAVTNWFALTDEVDNVQAPATTWVRLGEALLDEGHPEAAVSALDFAVSQKKPLTTALAQRVVRIARDLDPKLTRKAAETALRDPQLGDVEREELMGLSSEVTPARAPQSTPAEGPGAQPTAPSPESAAPPQPEAPLDVETAVELDEPQAATASLGVDDDFDDIDPNAIRLDSLEDALPLEIDDLAAGDAEAWNDPPLLTDLDQDHAFEGEMDDAFGDLDDDALARAAFDAGAIEEDDFAGGGASDTVTQVVAPSAIPRADETVTEVSVPAHDDDETTTVVTVAPTLRETQVRDAVPVTLEREGIVIEVEGGKKTRLPYARIEAIAAAAVSGLGAKPVVLIDFALNWQAAAEPLKLIRLRSDRFDPAALAPGAPSQLAAVQKLLSDLVEKSAASPLPNFSAATGTPFSVFDGMDAYCREVLGARHEA